MTRFGVMRAGLIQVISAGLMAGAMGIAGPAQAQVAACSPPAGGEYLLLVTSRTPEAQAKVRQSIPSGSTPVVCNYQGETVTRVNGFTTLDTANSWAQYLADRGLPTVVVRPAGATTPPTTPPTGIPPLPPNNPPATPPAVPPTVPSGGVPATNGYNPQPLGMGYAVIVNYFNRPEVAGQIQQALGKDVGLISYGQRPYLLATYTTDQTTANALLQSLSDKGFWAMVVDGRRTVLLKSPIAR
jgi:hypothetical protein